MFISITYCAVRWGHECERSGHSSPYILVTFYFILVSNGPIRSVVLPSINHFLDQFPVSLSLPIIFWLKLEYLPAPAAEAAAKEMFSVSERAKLHAAMVIFQIGYAGNHIILRVALNVGISKLVFLIYRTTIGLLLLSPFAYFLEK